MRKDKRISSALSLDVADNVDTTHFEHHYVYMYLKNNCPSCGSPSWKQPSLHIRRAEKAQQTEFCCLPGNTKQTSAWMQQCMTNRLAWSEKQGSPYLTGLPKAFINSCILQGVNEVLICLDKNEPKWKLGKEIKFSITNKPQMCLPMGLNNSRITLNMFN